MGSAPGDLGRAPVTPPEDGRSLQWSVCNRDSVAGLLGRRGLGGYGTHRGIKIIGTRKTQVLSSPTEPRPRMGRLATSCRCGSIRAQARQGI